MAPDSWIDDWARDIASNEACRVRATVRRAMVEGRAIPDLLAEVRFGLTRLTTPQREVLVSAIGRGD